MHLQLATSGVSEEVGVLGWRGFEHGLFAVWYWYWQISQHLEEEAVPQIWEEEVPLLVMALVVV